MPTSTPTNTPSSTVVSDNLKEFFAQEQANEEVMRRDSGDYDATFDPEDDLYVPESSLATALDSWRQAPNDVRASFLHVETLPPAEQTARIEQAEADLHALIAEHGDATTLGTLL